MTRSTRKSLGASPIIAALGLLLAVAGCGDGPGPQDGATAPRPPNVVVIVLDTTRADRCSVNGYLRPTTPTLEAIAREGAVFRTCWSPSPWTAPAHASLFTGLRPSNHGVAAASVLLRDDHVTLAEQLGSAGYGTACFTANDFVAAPFGLVQGFDHHWGAWEHTDSLTYPVAALAHGLALDWALEQHSAGRPFFVFVNDIEPHAPYEPHEPHLSRFAGWAGPEDLEAAEALCFPLTLGHTAGAIEMSPRQLEVASALYDAEIATVDATIGPFLEGLRRAGVLDETLVVITSDHGENLGERHQLEHVFSVNKTVLHVPLVIRFPAAFAAGTVVDDVVRLEDLFPTVLELCSVEVPPGLDGRSLLRDLPGRIARCEYGVQDHALATLVEHFPHADPEPFRVSMQSVFDGRYHLIRRSDGRENLYDVLADPLELHDLSGRSVRELSRLRALLSD